MSEKEFRQLHALAKTSELPITIYVRRLLAREHARAKS